MEVSYNNLLLLYSSLIKEGRLKKLNLINGSEGEIRRNISIVILIFVEHQI